MKETADSYSKTLLNIWIFKWFGNIDLEDENIIFRNYEKWLLVYRIIYYEYLCDSNEYLYYFILKM